MKKANKTILETNPATIEWKSDEKDFDKWFSQQRYSFGAMPTFTQVEEMKRVWCIARKSCRMGLPPFDTLRSQIASTANANG